MRELTIAELDMELAEQLPARELMGGSRNGHHCGCDGGGVEQENNNHQFGLINVNAANNWNDVNILSFDKG